MVHPGLRGPLILAALAMAAAPSLPQAQGQGPQQLPGVVRSRITLVPIDVRVLDEAGRPVTSLRESDFTVLEDDVPQKLQHFSTRIHSALAAADAKTAEPGIASAAPAAQRTFLIMLGRGRLEVPSKGLTATEDFVRALTGPEDRVSVMAYTRVTDATNDRESVLRLLTRYRERHEWVEAHLDQWFTGLTGTLGGREIPAHIQKAIDEIFDAPGLPALRDLPVVPPPGDGDFEDAKRRLVLAADPFPTGLPDDPSLLEEARQDFERLFAALEYLRYVPGDKHLIYVTEEPLLFGEKQLFNLTTLANDAMVSISALQTGGVAFTGWVYPRGFNIGSGKVVFRGRSFNQVWALTGLRGLAEDTGGLASFYQPAERLFRRVDDATQFQYVLGYYPPTANDGKYHRLKVRVNRDDVEVSHRRGYYARDEFTPTDPKAFLTHIRVTAAATFWREVRDIPTDLAILGVADDGVRVRVKVDASRVTFRREDGHHRASVDVGLFLVASNGDLAGEERRTISLTLTDEAYARTLAHGICHQTVVPVLSKARVKGVRAVAYDYEADRLGTATVVMGKSPATPKAGCQ